MSADISNALLIWQAAQANLQAAIATEVEARAILCQLAFPTPKIGTNNAPVGNGTVLKAKFDQYYKLDRDTEKVEAQLKRLPSAIRASLVKWTPDISKSAYKALEPGHKAIVNEILTITNARPSLEIVTPKAT